MREWSQWCLGPGLRLPRPAGVLLVCWRGRARSGAGVAGRRRAAAGWGRGQCHPDRGGGLCGPARLQYVGGDQRPAEDWQHHRARPRQGQGIREEAARRQEPAAWQQAGSGRYRLSMA